jgi:amidohydrolase
MDALPLTDTKDVPYRSTVPGACHACGHDVHTTVLLGAGLALAELARRGELPGKVRLIFQPSEEQIFHVQGNGKYVGAPEMIAAGCLKDVSAIFAMHCNPQVPVGQVAVRSGAFTAAADTVEVCSPDRAGTPPGRTSPSTWCTRWPGAGRRAGQARPPARPAQPGEHGVRRGARGRGRQHHPQRGWARATVRTLSIEAWRTLPELIDKLVHDALAGTGAQVEVKYARGVPPVVNDALATTIIGRAAAEALGPHQVIEAEVSMGGEDFACYQEHVPGAMIRLGVGTPARRDVDIHQSEFDVDEAAIGHGVRVFVHTALDAIDAYSR